MAESALGAANDVGSPASSRCIDLRIALLEDDAEQAEHTAALLRGVGHHVNVFSRGRALLRQLNSETYDLIMLDWEIPDVSGYDVLHAIRKQQAMRVPVLFLTHRGDEADVVEALAAGADDFLVKPARERELLARVDAVSRRSRDGSPADEVMDVPPFRIDLTRREIQRDGVAFELTRREFEVATLLFSNVGKLLSRGHIMQTVWGQNVVTTTRTVDMHVSRVRKVLGLSAAIGLRLTAIYGYGYRLERTGTPAA
jgi:two-component system, OmpR family, response regulator RegX3